MDIRRVTDTLSALATPSRLEVLRVLARAGKDGMPSGKLAEELKTRQNTLSTQLSLLASVDLVQSERLGRFIIYRVNADTLYELQEFLRTEVAPKGAKQGRRPKAA